MNTLTARGVPLEASTLTTWRRNAAPKPIAAMLGLYLLIGALTRGVLWLAFGHVDGVSLAELFALMPLGAVNDLMQAAYLLLPLSLLFALAPRARAPQVIGIGLLIALMLFVGVSEYFFFEEFDARFNLVAVDYLIYPTEVIGDIRDEYPVGPALMLIAALAMVLTWMLLRRYGLYQSGSRRQALKWLGVHVVMALAVTALWTADRLSPFSNRVANELAANGATNFFAAFRNNHIDYPVFYRSGDSAQMQARLVADLQRGGGQFTNLPAGDLTRRFEPRPGLGRLNVVVLVEESLGAGWVGAYGDTRGLTPEFDRLARDGVLFTRAYATGTRTVRGLEAISASLPPIPSESVVKREGNADIATWAKVMNRAGYHSSFLYGGFGAFDNMNAYFGNNGFAISDRADIPNPRFANIWGVSDEDLMHHAVGYFDARAKEGKPFFSMVMSTSNHKPFTFPDGVPGVQPRGGRRPSGVRYADHAIGQFMREAATRPWFNDTLFVIVADHDARVYGRADLPLNTYEIPLLIYAPAHLRPGAIDTPTSQIDVAPTVLGMLGFGY
ncbi:MAG: LTA synthase family protein, partial [Panacagrimonas sp.]